MNDNTDLKLSYRFADHHEANPAMAGDITEINHVLTFGNLYQNDRYDAHQLMLSVSYKL